MPEHTPSLRPALSSRRQHSDLRSVRHLKSLLRTTYLFALLIVFAGPGEAEWLVTRDGQAIETDGAWRARANSTFFSRTDGARASIPTRRIDIPASRELTHTMRERAQQRQAVPLAVPAESVLRLTDDDVRHVEPIAAVERSTDNSPGTDELAESAHGPSEVAHAVAGVRNWLDRKTESMIIEGQLERLDPMAPLPSEVTIEILEGGQVVDSTVAEVFESPASAGEDSGLRFRGSTIAQSDPQAIRIRF